MSNTTYIVSRRTGGLGSCAAGKRRISTTISEATFQALQANADAAHHSLSGEASDAIERDLARAAALQAGRAT